MTTELLDSPVVELDARSNPRDVVLATRVNQDDAVYIHGACMERGITMSEFLREAAIEWASR